MSNGSQALGKRAKLGIVLTSLVGALGAVFRVRSPERPHDTESSGLRGASRFSLPKRIRKVPKILVFLGLVLVVVLASAMVRALAASGGCATPTITWVGNANSEPDSWHTASNWSANRVPGTGDNVCIPNAANTNAIDFSTGSTSVASLESEEALNISGGTLELTSATDDSKVSSFTFSGGTLSGAGNLTIPAGGSATWSGGHMMGTGKTVISEASGSQPAATLSITGSDDKALREARVLRNAGTTTFSATYLQSGASGGAGAVIENSGTFEIRGDGDILNGYGTPRTRFENTGTLKKTSGTASSDIFAKVANTGGTVDVASGTLNLAGGFDNFSSTAGVGKLTGGTYMIRSNSILQFTSADIDVNAATIVLDGLGSAIVDQNGSDAIDDLSDNDGSFTIKSDRDLKTVGALRNDGSITLGKDSILTTTGEYLQADGSTVLEDTTSKLAAPGSRVRVQDGAMKGLGTVEPVLEATGGRVQPGLSTGILKVAGRYAPGSNGTLEVEIGGTAPGSGYDQLDVGTTASLGGTLDIITPSSFTPTPGQSFTILTCRVVACRSGQFNTVQGTHVRPGLDYQVRYNATDVTLELVNNPPVADDQPVTTDEDVAKEVTLHASDPENDSLTYPVVSNPAHGSLSGTGANLTYTPESNFFGEDSFTFKANDGNSDSNVATVRITVNPVNDAPVAKDDPAETDEDTAKDINVLGNDEDLDADSLHVSSVGSANHGTVTKNDDNTIKYVPEANYNGPDEFTYTVSDGNGGTATATVSITVNAVNDAPVAKDDTAGTDEDTPTNIDVIANDEDVDNTNAELSLSSFTQPSHGQVSLDNGKLRYEPALDYNGSDTFTYKAKDASNADSNEATVTIDVKSVNPAAPVITNLQGADAANEGETTAYTFQITDPDSTNFSFASGSPTCGGTGKGEVVGTPVINNDRSGSFECRFLDGGVPPTQVSVSVQVKDESQASSGVTSKNVSVSNVAPKIESLSGPAQVLTNQPVTFTGTHSDPAGLLDNPFTWQWSGGTSTDTDKNNSYVTKFSACGPQNVKATVTDKDGGTSAPLQTGKDNLVQKGQVILVKISVTGCDGINLAGLSPYLQLFSGDPTTAINEADFIVPTTSVAADTGQTMRPVPDGYVYNLRVPSDAKAKAGAMYYIRVSPFGVESGQHMIISIQIRK